MLNLFQHPFFLSSPAFRGAMDPEPSSRRQNCYTEEVYNEQSKKRNAQLNYATQFLSSKFTLQRQQGHRRDGGLPAFVLLLGISAHSGLRFVFNGQDAIADRDTVHG
jgi:hypothetical protein